MNVYYEDVHVKKLLIFFDISKYDFLVEEAYTLGSRIEFPAIVPIEYSFISKQ
jgi:hypothetical protein